MNDSNKVESFCCTLIFVDTFAAVWIARSLHISLSLFLHFCDCVVNQLGFALCKPYTNSSNSKFMRPVEKSRKTERQKEKQTPRKRAYWIHRFSESSILSVHIHLLSTVFHVSIFVRYIHIQVYHTFCCVRCRHQSRNT